VHNFSSLKNKLSFRAFRTCFVAAANEEGDMLFNIDFYEFSRFSSKIFIGEMDNRVKLQVCNFLRTQYTENY